MKAERIYTIGYQGKKPEAFWALLEAAGVDALIDTRAVPWSPRPQFTKKALKDEARFHGNGHSLTYYGLPGLGIASKERKEAAADGSVGAMLIAYQARMIDIPLDTEPLRSLTSIFGVKERPALLCCEAHPIDCHRSRLADVLAARLGLSIEHL